MHLIFILCIGLFAVVLGTRPAYAEGETLEVRTDVVPDDASTWDISVTGAATHMATLADGGSTTVPAAVAGSYTISLAAGAGTSLNDYSVAYTCTVNGAGSSPNGSGTLISVEVGTGEAVVCKYTLTRLTTLVLTKSDGDVTTTAPGTLITYNLTYNNTGSTSASDVVINETVPAATSFVADSSTAGWSCSPNNSAGSICTFPVGALATNTNGSTTFVVRVDSTLAAGVDQTTNTATIAATNTSTSTTASDSTPLRASPVFTLTKSNRGTVATPGNEVVFDLNYANNGTQGSSTVVITEVVPAGTTFFAAGASDGWSCTPDSNAGSTCTIPLSIAAGVTGTVTFAVLLPATVPAGFGQFSNTATIGDAEVAPVASNTVTTLVNAQSTFTLSKSASVVSTTPGGTVDYTLTYKNTGNQTATGVVITDTVPANVRFRGPGSTPGWVCNPANGKAGSVCRIVVGDVAAGATSSVLFKVKVNSPLPATATSVNNTAYIGHSNAAFSAQATKVLAIKGTVALSLAKSDGGIAAEPGDTVVYNLAYRNTGNFEATGVVITETVPANSTFNGSGWSCPIGAPAGTVCKRTIGNVAGGGAGGSVEFKARVISPFPIGPTQISNTAQLGHLQKGNKTVTVSTVSDTTPVQAAPGLSISKDDGGISALPGSTIDYTLNYANNGNQDALGVMITEIVPANTTFVGPPGIWSCPVPSAAGASCSYSVGTLAAAAGSAIHFQVQLPAVLPAGVEEIQNTAFIGNPLTPNADSGSDTTAVNASAGLGLTKDDGNVVAVPGELITYTLSYENNGNQDASGVLLTEIVPANTTFEGSEDVWSCTVGAPAGTSCVAIIGNLVAGSNGSLLFPVRVLTPLASDVPQINNTATLGDSQKPTAATATDTTPVSGTPTFTLAKDDVNDSAAPGGTIVYQLDYANTGNRAAIDVVLKETVPAHTTFDLGSSTPGWLCPSNIAGTLCTFPIGALAGGGSGGQLLFGVKVDSPLLASVTTVTNTATIGDSQTPDAVSKSDPTLIVGSPVYNLTKSDSNATTTPGGVVIYKLSYKNVGNQEATTAKLTETVPANTSFEAASSTAGWVCTPDGSANSQCVFTIGSLLGGGVGGTVNFAVRVNTTVPAGVEELSNTAYLGDALAPTSTQATDKTPVIAAPSLALSKSDNGVSAEPSDIIVYTLRYGNNGNQGTTGVKVTETVPANTTFNGDTADWSCAVGAAAGSTCIHTVGGLAAGTTKDLTFKVKLAAALPAGVSQVVNTASMGDDSTPTATTATDSTPVQGKTGLSLSKDDNGATVRPGESSVYTLTYVNNGTQGAAGVVVTETIPANTTFVGPTSDWNCAVGAAAGTVCTHSVGNLAVGTSGVLNFRVRVNPTLAAGIKVVENVAAIGDSLKANVDTGSDETNITATPELRLSKTDNGVSAAPGDTVVYVLSYVNEGNQGATGVVITETVPANTSFVATASTAGWVCASTSAGSSCRLVIGGLAAGATGSANFAVQVSNPLSAGTAQLSNQAMLADDGQNGPDGNLPNNSAADTTPISGTPQINALKRVFTAVDADNDGAVTPGDTLEYVITISNTGNIAATAVSLNDTFDQNSKLAGNNAVQTTAGTVTKGQSASDKAVIVTIGTLNGGASVEVRFRVMINSVLPAGVTAITNQGVVRSNELNGVNTDDPDVAGPANPTVAPISGEPNVTARLTDFLFVDADSDNQVSDGDTLIYRAEIVNTGKVAAVEVVLETTPDANTALQIGSAHTDRGSVVLGNGASHTGVKVNIGSLAGGGGRVNVDFQVKLDKTTKVNQITTQAVISFKKSVAGSLFTVNSDDPDTASVGDSTKTIVNHHPTVAPIRYIYLPLIARK